MKKKLSLEHAVEAFAGLMILISVALTYFVHPGWMWLTVFVGVNLFQQAFTGFCPAAIILRKVFGFRTESELATA
jgi:Inner membrane protein YgaP-like, transmembrane domain